MSKEQHLTVQQVAKRTGYTVGTVQHYMTAADFPPPRSYGPYGRKLYAISDIDFWLECRRKALKRSCTA